jgi:hypothetical protein
MTATAACEPLTGCAVNFTTTGAPYFRLVNGSKMYFVEGKFTRAAALCDLGSAAAMPGTVAAPSNSCAVGMHIVYADGYPTCVADTAGGTSPGDSGTAPGSSWPTSCPSWLSSVCAWFAEDDAAVRDLGKGKSNAVDAALQALPETEINTTAALSWINGGHATLYNFGGSGSASCPSNPVVPIPGGTSFTVPFDKVCAPLNSTVRPVLTVVGYLLFMIFAFRGVSL